MRELATIEGHVLSHLRDFVLTRSLWSNKTWSFTSVGTDGVYTTTPLSLFLVKFFSLKDFYLVFTGYTCPCSGTPSESRESITNRVVAMKRVGLRVSVPLRLAVVPPQYSALVSRVESTSVSSVTRTTRQITCIRGPRSSVGRRTQSGPGLYTLILRSRITMCEGVLYQGFTFC